MEDIQLEGRAGRLGLIMTAVVAVGPSGKQYRLPTDLELQLATEADKEIESVFAKIPFGLPNEPTPAGGGSGAADGAESSANGNAMVAQSTVAPFCIVIDMTAAPTDVSMTVAASFGSGSIADEAAPESVSIPTSPLLAFTISSAITVNPSANDRPAANNSDSSPSSSFNDSVVRHLQLDDFYRQLSITATPKADTGHATGIDGGVEQTTNSCVDELLADLVDPQLLAL
jgi:hypothetical protein